MIILNVLKSVYNRCTWGLIHKCTCEGGGWERVLSASVFNGT